jgi:hypothetical protein
VKLVVPARRAGKLLIAVDQMLDRPLSVLYGGEYPKIRSVLILFAGAEVEMRLTSKHTVPRSGIRIRFSAAGKKSTRYLPPGCTESQIRKAVVTGILKLWKGNHETEQEIDE